MIHFYSSKYLSVNIQLLKINYICIFKKKKHAILEHLRTTVAKSQNKIAVVQTGQATVCWGRMKGWAYDELTDTSGTQRPESGPGSSNYIVHNRQQTLATVWNSIFPNTQFNMQKDLLVWIISDFIQPVLNNYWMNEWMNIYNEWCCLLCGHKGSKAEDLIDHFVSGTQQIKPQLRGGEHQQIQTA